MSPQPDREIVALRARKKARTRQDLVDHALRLFIEQGYENTTVEQIVASADYSRSTFFHHFRNKEDVVFTDADDFYDKLRRRLQHAPDGDGWDVVVQVLLDLTRESALDPTLNVGCRRLWYTEPALAGRYHSTLMRWETALATFIAERDGVDLEDGGARALDIRIVTANLMSTLRVCIRHYLIDGGDLAASFARASQVVHRTGMQIRTGRNACP